MACQRDKLIFNVAKDRTPVGNKIGDGSTALSFNHLVELKETFLDADINKKGSDTLLVNQKSYGNLLKMTQITSKDYTNNYMTEDG